MVAAVDSEAVAVVTVAVGAASVAVAVVTVVVAAAVELPAEAVVVLAADAAVWALVPRWLLSPTIVLRACTSCAARTMRC